MLLRILMSLAFLTIYSADVGGQPLTDQSVSRPFGLFDLEGRRAEIKGTPDFEPSVCGRNFGPVPIPDVEVVGHGAFHTILTNPFPYTSAVAFIDGALGDYLVSGEKVHLEDLREWLVKAAEAGSFTVLVPDPDKYRYIDPLFNLRLVLIPIIVGFDALRQAAVLTPQQDALIFDWLESVIENSDKDGCEAEWCDPPNHTTALRGTSFMLWGAAAESDKWFQKGLSHFSDLLGASRSDGSNRNDVVPEKADGPGGARGLRKQNQVVGYMMVMAEIASSQGLDLFSAKVGKKDVWLALEFLVNGIKDDDVVRKHTRAKSHSTPFLENTQHNDESVAWFEIVKRRFPQHPLTKEFEELVKAQRPWSSAAYGGNLSCYFWLPS